MAIYAELARKDEIVAIAESYGFVVLGAFEHERQETVSLYFEVPPGSSPAAAAALSEALGAIEAEPSGYLYADRDPCMR